MVATDGDGDDSPSGVAGSMSMPPVWEEEHYWEESLHSEAMFVDGFTRIKEIQHHKLRLRSRWHQSQHLRNSPAEDF